MVASTHPMVTCQNAYLYKMAMHESPAGTNFTKIYLFLQFIKLL